MPSHNAESVSVCNPSEKMSAANDAGDIADISYAGSKPESAEDSGEVFQHAEYRALGWFVHLVALQSRAIR